MKSTGTKLVKLIISLLLVQIAVLALFYVKFNHNQNAFERAQKDDAQTLVQNQANFQKIQKANAKALVDNNRKSCELGKIASQNLADFETAQAEYIRTVTGAASVKEDVKKAARKALRTFKRTSAAAQRRAHRDCIKAFPYNTKGF